MFSAHHLLISFQAFGKPFSKDSHIFPLSNHLNLTVSILGGIVVA